MSTFKIKDLMINLSGAGANPQLQCLTNTNFCLCLSQPFTGCLCLSQPFTGCLCLSRPFTGCFCLSHPITFCQCGTHPVTFCPGGSIVCPGGSIDCGGTQIPIDIPQDIATLREQLKQQLALLDQQEAAQESQMKPQTFEEAEQLEHKMKEALAEIQKMKEDFKK
jgi:hypothetical protein